MTTTLAPANGVDRWIPAKQQNIRERFLLLAGLTTLTPRYLARLSFAPVSFFPCRSTISEAAQAFPHFEGEDVQLFEECFDIDVVDVLYLYLYPCYAAWIRKKGRSFPSRDSRSDEKVLCACCIYSPAHKETRQREYCIYREVKDRLNRIDWHGTHKLMIVFRVVGGAGKSLLLVSSFLLLPSTVFCFFLR